MQAEALTLLWAKFDQSSSYFHPLICHLIDSGNVAAAIWQNVLTENLKSQFNNLFSLDDEEARRAIQFLTALHDIGKASPAFQSSNPDIQKRLEDIGLPFPKKSRYSPQRHDLISLWILQEALFSNGFLSQEDAELIAQVLGGHHGYFHSSLEILSYHRQKNLGEAQWHELREQIFQVLCELIQPPKLLALHGDASFKQSTLILLTGLVVAADWLASDKDYFHYWQEKELYLQDYDHLSYERALKALKTTGWISWKPDKSISSFFDLFKEFQSANPIQQAVINKVDLVQPPFLAILEAPTGQGKTEAAFFLADHAIHSVSLRGLYIAMPTMATSNQMFTRTKKFLSDRYPQTFVNIQLAHSQAAWNPDLKSIAVQAVGQDIDSEAMGISAMKWFQPRKKTLLAPFGVGTVDQALISVLKTKHFFLRLFGLAHKVLIFDEVHAYDVYMSTLFVRLLEWLKLLGCSVIILSATLPQRMKKELASVYAPKPLPDEDMQKYPSLTLISGNQSEVVQVEAGAEQAYNLDHIGAEMTDIVNYLEAKIDKGGCAAIVCNTVKKAQQVYLALKGMDLVDLHRQDESLLLFHARYPQLWRQEIENEVLTRFGKKNDKRPTKAILVATQVIEQSLDLDFDLMISELAPIDLLIQRAGRLHRHAGEKRPEKLEKPKLAIAVSEENGEPDFKASVKIYDESILLATYYALQHKNILRLPQKTRGLIELVYNPFKNDGFDIKQQEKLRPLFEKSMQSHEQEERIAYDKVIPRAGDESLLRLGAMPLEEDDPEIHQAFQALTRLSLPSVCLVCLQEKEDRLFTLDGLQEIDLRCKPDEQQVEALLKSSVSVIRNHRINQLIESIGRPDAWRKNAWLSHCYPIVFRDGTLQANEKLYFYISRELGLYMEEK